MDQSNENVPHFGEKLREVFEMPYDHVFRTANRLRESHDDRLSGVRLVQPIDGEKVGIHLAEEIDIEEAKKVIEDLGYDVKIKTTKAWDGTTSRGPPNDEYEMISWFDGADYHGLILEGQRTIDTEPFNQEEPLPPMLEFLCHYLSAKYSSGTK